jgi:hypothetical protein
MAYIGSIRRAVVKSLLTLCLILYLGTLCAESSRALRALWARSVSENGGGFPTVIDGVTLTPSQDSIGLILKYDTKGNAYAVGYVGPGEHLYGDTVSLKGMLGQNPVIVKYDPLGRAVWARGLAEDSVSSWDYDEGGGPSSKYSGVAVDREGGIYAVGDIDGGKILFSDTAPQFHNAIDSSSKHGAVIVKYDSSGKALWASGFAGEGTHGKFRAVQADDRGGA